MTALLLGGLVAVALASPLDVERGRAALQAGRIAEGRDDLQRSLVDDPEDPEALRLYAEAREAEGASALVLPELAGLAAHSVAAGVIHDEIEVERGLADPKVLSDRAGGDGWDLALLALARIALHDGHPEVALASLQDATDPTARSLRLAARVADARDRDALKEGRELAADLPDRPDLLLPLLGAGAQGTGGRARAVAVRAAERLVDKTRDPVTLYRARRVLVAAGEKEEAAKVVAVLGSIGEPPVLARMPYDAAMRDALARGLVRQRDPVIPDGPPDEVRDLALRVAGLLHDMGRVQEAVGVFEAARKRADCPELALAHAELLLRMGRAKDALAAARDAERLATQPSEGDIGRENLRAWRTDLAAALLLEASALAAAERLEEALDKASTSALLVPTTEAWTLVGTLDAKLGDAQAAFVAFSMARMLGGETGDALAATWTGFGPAGTAADAVAADLADQLGVQLPEGLAAAPTDASEGPRVGAASPDFEVQTDAGTWTADSEHGRVVVLSFFASWCAPCRLDLPALAKLARAHADDPVDFLAVSIDDRPKAFTRFLAQNDLDGLHVTRDPDLAGTWGVHAVPTTWILDPQGVLRHFHQGYGPGDQAKVEAELQDLLEP